MPLSGNIINITYDWKVNQKRLMLLRNYLNKCILKPPVTVCIFKENQLRRTLNRTLIAEYAENN